MCSWPNYKQWSGRRAWEFGDTEYRKRGRIEREVEREEASERNNHWGRNVLSAGAPANCLAHEFVGRVSRLLDVDPALPPQGCWHLGSPDDSSVRHEHFLQATAASFPPRGSPLHPPASEVAWLWWIGILCVCQTALWLFNEAIRQTEPPLPQPLLGAWTGNQNRWIFIIACSVAAILHWPDSQTSTQYHDSMR